MFLKLIHLSDLARLVRTAKASLLVSASARRVGLRGDWRVKDIAETIGKSPGLAGTRLRSPRKAMHRAAALNEVGSHKIDLRCSLRVIRAIALTQCYKTLQVLHSLIEYSRRD